MRASKAFFNGAGDRNRTGDGQLGNEPIMRTLVTLVHEAEARGLVPRISRSSYQRIHALGDYGHVSVRAARGHLTILVEDGAPVARATPLGAGQFGLSFHTHTGRWEPMPVVADLTRLAHDLIALLGPYLQRWDFPGRNSGSDH